MKRSKTISLTTSEPDGVIFILNKHECMIIELKDGDTFDTKKVEGELQSLDHTLREIAPKIHFAVIYYICGFNSKSKKDLKLGLKRKFTENNLLTGKELCEILNINFDDIINKRKKRCV